MASLIKTKTKLKLPRYLEINEESYYSQISNSNINNLLKNDFIIEFLNKKVEDGILSKITSKNLPYYFVYRKEDLDRKLKIQKIKNDFNIKLIDNSTYYTEHNDAYKANIYETNVIRECKIDAEPKLLDTHLNQIFKYCSEVGITHIYEIIEKRFGIEINKADLSMSNIFKINNFDDFGLYKYDIKNKAYNYDINECYDEIDEKITSKYKDKSIREEDGDIDYYEYNEFIINKLKDSDKPNKLCYIFNEVSYTVRGIKTFDKTDIEEFNKCKSDFEYFHKKYIKK